LNGCRQEAKDAYWAEQVDIQWQVTSAWLLYADGKHDAALRDRYSQRRLLMRAQLAAYFFTSSGSTRGVGIGRASRSRSGVQNSVRLRSLDCVRAESI